MQKSLILRSIPEFVQATLLSQKGNYLEAHQLYCRIIQMLKGDSTMELVQRSYSNALSIPNFKIWNEILMFHTTMIDRELCKRMTLEKLKNLALYQPDLLDNKEIQNFKQTFDGEEIYEIELIHSVQVNLNVTDQLRKIIQKCDGEKFLLKKKLESLLFLNQWWLHRPYQELDYFNNSLPDLNAQPPNPFENINEYSQEIKDLQLKIYQGYCDYLFVKSNERKALGERSQQFLKFCEINNNGDVQRPLLVMARMFAKEKQVLINFSQNKKYLRAEGLYRALEDITRDKSLSLEKLVFEGIQSYEYGVLLGKLTKRETESKQKFESGAEMISLLGFPALKAKLYIYELPNYLMRQ